MSDFDKYCEEDESGNLVLINVAKRLGIQYCPRVDDMGDAWFASYSPRNRNYGAEGFWSEWVELAKAILAHPLTVATASADADRPTLNDYRKMYRDAGYPEDVVESLVSGLSKSSMGGNDET